MTHKQQPLIFLEAWIRVSQSNVLIDQLTWQSSLQSNQVANVCRNDYHHDKTRNVYPYTTFNKKLYFQHTIHPTYNSILTRAT